MVSLKMTKAEAKAEGYGQAVPGESKPPEYPWGTCLTLTDEAVRALFPNGLPKVGDKVALDCMGEIRSTNEVKQDGGASRVSVEIQLTDAEIEEDEDEQPSTASRIYGAGPRNSED